MVGFTLFMSLIPGSSDPTVGLINSRLKHAMTFFVLALVMDRFAFPTRQLELWKPFSLLAFGVLIEILQWFTGYRTFSVIDMVADGLGITVYYLLSFVFVRKAELQLSDV